MRGRRIAIVGHLGRAQVRREAARLRTALARCGAVVRLERELAGALRESGEPLTALARWCQVMISLGGDGTVLTAGRALAGQRGVLLAVNMGGLGFLAAAEPRELDAAVTAALGGRWAVATRTGVETRVKRARGGRARRVGFAFNDAVIRSAVSYTAIHLRVAALGHDLGHLVADGLIAASASGSTAYSRYRRRSGQWIGWPDAGAGARGAARRARDFLRGPAGDAASGPQKSRAGGAGRSGGV